MLVAEKILPFCSQAYNDQKIHDMHISTLQNDKKHSFTLLKQTFAKMLSIALKICIIEHNISISVPPSCLGDANGNMIITFHA